MRPERSTDPLLADGVCGQGECRRDHRDDAGYEAARRAFLRARAASRRAGELVTERAA